MNNYCRNCGEKLNSNDKQCPKCHAKVFEKRIDVKQKKLEIKEFKRKETIYVIIIFSLYAIAYLVAHLNISKNNNFVSNTSSLFLLGSVITLVYARITLNKSIIIRVLFGILIGIIIISIIWIIFLFATCGSIFNRDYY